MSGESPSTFFTIQSVIPYPLKVVGLSEVILVHERFGTSDAAREDFFAQADTSLAGNVVGYAGKLTTPLDGEYEVVPTFTDVTVPVLFNPGKLVVLT